MTRRQPVQWHGKLHFRPHAHAETGPSKTGSFAREPGREPTRIACRSRLVFLCLCTRTESVSRYQESVSRCSSLPRQIPCPYRYSLVRNQYVTTANSMPSATRHVAACSVPCFLRSVFTTHDALPTFYSLHLDPALPIANLTLPHSWVWCSLPSPFRALPFWARRFLGCFSG
jgi:hypothetical protein